MTIWILTTRRIDWRKLERRLSRDGHLSAQDTSAQDTSTQDTSTQDTSTQDTVSRADQQITVTVDRPDLAALPTHVIDSARRLLGVNPTHSIACTCETQSAGPAVPDIVVDIARAVAADAPITVLDDHAGTTYLVHPKRGLVGPEEYEAVARRTALSAGESRPGRPAGRDPHLESRRTARHRGAVETAVMTVARGRARPPDRPATAPGRTRSRPPAACRCRADRVRGLGAALPEPMLPLALFRNRNFSGASLSIVLLSFAGAA